MVVDRREEILLQQQGCYIQRTHSPSHRAMAESLFYFTLPCQQRERDFKVCLGRFEHTAA